MIGNKSLTLLFGLTVLLCSCSPISKEAKEELAKPVDCSTASDDIATLKSEKASVAKEISAGVQDIYPVGAIIHLIERNWTDGEKVATGQYNKAIEDKIERIQNECGVQ
jgi:hypothetical protein